MFSTVVLSGKHHHFLLIFAAGNTYGDLAQFPLAQVAFNQYVRTKMGFSGVKRPIEILYKRLNGPLQFGHEYSSLTIRGIIANKIGGSANLYTSRYASGSFEFGFPTRRYSTDVSALDQMGLIKLLRERTSAPIKEVKAALVGSNWDIGKSETLCTVYDFVFP
nr:elongation factor Ts, mitochondrial [Ipomoea batatas]GMD99875.1 elongation factor Ts, mitochondrial [Ipomoea batatas]GME21807.1 elongation factor Ts, mitochondrial [Ipomoea batatas]